jgi:hypothetical protein
VLIMEADLDDWNFYVMYSATNLVHADSELFLYSNCDVCEVFMWSPFDWVKACRGRLCARMNVSRVARCEERAIFLAMHRGASKIRFTSYKIPKFWQIYPA